MGFLDNSTAEDEAKDYRLALEEIVDIAFDYDGYRTVKSLKELVDELRKRAKTALYKYK